MKKQPKGNSDPLRIGGGGLARQCRGEHAEVPPTAHGEKRKGRERKKNWNEKKSEPLSPDFIFPWNSSKKYHRNTLKNNKISKLLQKWPPPLILSQSWPKMGSTCHPCTALDAFGPPFLSQSAPKMALVDAFGDLWGALGMAGWGPWAPRDAAGRKVEKNTWRSLFGDPKWSQFGLIFDQNSRHKLCRQNQLKKYTKWIDIQKKTWPELGEPRNIKQTNSLHFEEM